MNTNACKRCQVAPMTVNTGDPQTDSLLALCQPCTDAVFVGDDIAQYFLVLDMYSRSE